ncbi:MAG TPA: biosynthetic arginine decarboxylase [Arenimonas sp.]|nr:biosynthetic arginine decarboxylase [Arenimonas sp.]
MSAWSVEHAKQLYSMPYWSEGYFDIDAAGRVCAQPLGPEGPRLPIPELIEQAARGGVKLPLLLRFSDILPHRLQAMQRAFNAGMGHLGYKGGYTAVYPIKVNQHFGVAGVLAAAGNEQFGLEAGSKPELMAVLGLAKPGSVIVCNGYKDREFIHLALLGKQLGFDTTIVVEKPSELDMILQEAAKLGVTPGIGVRLRLSTLGAGKWQNSGGDKAKFGLSPRQVLDLVERLRAAGQLDCLQLLHFHMGSQISNLRDIAAGMREAVRYFVELSKAGCGIRFMDSGGGLGVDYEGTRSRGACSINYRLEQFAQTLIQPLQEACAEHGLPEPRMITEAGRAMTAHHAMMVVNVSEVEQAPDGAVPDARKGEPLVIKHLRDLVRSIDSRTALEVYLEAQHYLAEGQALFAHGQLGLDDRALLDDLFYAIAHAVRRQLNPDDKSHREVLDELDERLVDKYFVNFSVFESIPDVWAIDQVFPIMPIARLDERPERHGVIADLTCDSDGRVDTYVQSQTLGHSLPVHALKQGESYRLGVFMVGAYQETLGDIHNLFGDTDTANVRLDALGGYSIERQRKGDTTDVMLDYVGYKLDDLRARYRHLVDHAGLDPAQAQSALDALETGLTGYTYLEETLHGA